MMSTLVPCRQVSMVEIYCRAIDLQGESSAISYRSKLRVL